MKWTTEINGKHPWGVLPTAHRHRPRWTTSHTPGSLGWTAFHLDTALALRGPHRSRRKTPKHRIHQDHNLYVWRVRTRPTQEMDINVAFIVNYTVSLLSCLRSRQLYRIESLHLPGHPSTIAVPRDMTKETPCTWKSMRYVSMKNWQCKEHHTYLTPGADVCVVSTMTFDTSKICLRRSTVNRVIPTGHSWNWSGFLCEDDSNYVYVSIGKILLKWILKEQCVKVSSEFTWLKIYHSCEYGNGISGFKNC